MFRTDFTVGFRDNWCLSVATPLVLRVGDELKLGPWTAAGDRRRRGGDRDAAVTTGIVGRDALVGPVVRNASGHLVRIGARIWRYWNLQPWRQETYKFSTDPEWTQRSATPPPTRLRTRIVPGRNIGLCLRIRRLGVRIPSGAPCDVSRHRNSAEPAFRVQGFFFGRP